MSGRTPSSILRAKRAAGQEAGGGKRRAKSFGGRRVSFAPDDELETMHLFTDKNTPSPLPNQQQLAGGDTQPLGELQNLVHASMQSVAAAGAGFGAFDKPDAPAQPRFESQSPAFTASGGAGAAAGAASPFSPVSMDITNDTLQQDAAAAAAAAARAPDADLSLTFDGGAGGLGLGDGTGTFNITDHVPGLSTLIEEDEEAFAADGHGSPEGVVEDDDDEGGGGAGPDATAEMELTGVTALPEGFEPTRAITLPSPSPARYNTRRSSARGVGDAGAAEAAAAVTPASAARGGRRSSARTSGAGLPAFGDLINLSTPTSVVKAAVTPTRSAAKSPAPSAAASPAPQAATPPEAAAPPASPLPAKSPARSAAKSAAGSAAKSAPKSPARSTAKSPASVAKPAVSPSPLRRRSSRLSTGAPPSPLPTALQLPEAEAGAEYDGAHAASDAAPEADAPAAMEEADAVAEAEAEAPPARAPPSPLALSPVAEMDDEGASTGRRATGSSLGGLSAGQPTVDTATLRDKWGFVPGDDDNTMALELHGLGGLGEATLHNVYAEDTATNDVPQELRAAAAPEAPEAEAEAEAAPEAPEPPAAAAAEPAAPPARPMTRSRRSSIAVAPTLSAIAESTGAPSPAASLLAASPAPSPMAAAPSPAPLSPALGAAPSPAPAGSAPATPESVLEGADAGGAEADEGLTTKLMQIMGDAGDGMDDAGEEDMGDADMEDAPAPAAAPTPSPAPAAAEAAPAPAPEAQTAPRISIGGGRGSVGSNMIGAAGLMSARRGGGDGGGAAAGAQPLGATTRLLADSAELAALAGAAAAPAAAAPPPAFDDMGFTGHLLADATGASAFVPRRATGGLALPPGLSPVPGAGAGAGPRRPSMDLIAGGRRSVLADDNTLEQFALPPELGGQYVPRSAQRGASHRLSLGLSQAPGSVGTGSRRVVPALSEDRGATMPFSGALGHAYSAMTPGGGHAVASRAAQPITFQDFLQVVDMQFLDHIRRGTSINMMDLAPGPVPNDLTEALKALILTAPEVSVLEGALNELHGAMRAKRSQVHALEEDLEAVNPEVFSTVQVARRSDLEALKLALVVRKKCCRAMTGSAWKQLRAGMERRLAERLAQSQRLLDQELGFVQNKLQRAQQQRQLVGDFTADIARSMEEELAAYEAAAAAQARLRYARARLEELRAINSERQRRADEVAAEAARLQAECGKLAAEREEAAQHADRLSAAATAPTPARGEPCADRLIDAGERLDILTGLQPWRLQAAPGGGWALRFRTGLACRVEVSGERAALEVAFEAPGGGAPALQTAVLKQLASTLPARTELPTRQLRSAVPPLALRLDAMASLAERLGRAFAAWRPLSGVRVEGASGEVVLSFVDAARGAKMEVALPLPALLERTARPAAASLRLVAAPAGWQARADAAGAELAAALGAAGADALDAACRAVCGALAGAAREEEAAAAAAAAAPAPPQTPPSVTLAA
ncbi:hypothetical protein Rsub_04022 [Raphidocelis subcapitata]|uniref:Spc7 kinetochore protein domain-containing protein n=1 Tax=Raphidocelis subcapitata TaxID=307507 RepID=A0A2V0NVP6_9CHLO|nr:hypothetical protein Rsub_04022 [Raphidocelis subcapitata]|eukprot:GBF91718.1 hypothetical protein Rsub_04022 [Raphidocelis subcapitata]